jgi:hypothetical protein
MRSHTFVVLAYKESPFLRQCLDSLCGQTQPASIVLATSTPSCFLDDIARQYKLPIYVNSGDKGLAADWTFGLRQGQSKYVTLAHQDDLYDARYVEQMTGRAEERPDTLITFSDYDELLGDRRLSSTTNLRIKRLLRTFSYLYQCHVSSAFRKKLLLAFGSPIPCPSVMYNRELLGDFSFSTDFSINADWDAWLRIAGMPGTIAYVREALLVHRIHEQSETSSGIGDRRRATEDLRLFETIWPKPVARGIARLYELSYHGNSVS